MGITQEDRKNFINRIKGPVSNEYKDNKILAIVTIAQAILESGWGKNAIGNNIFGIRSTKSWKGKVQYITTREVIKGKNEKQHNQAFRDYDSIEACIKDHNKILSLPRYKNVISADTYEKACIALEVGGYSTDPMYAETLISIIKHNKLEQYI